jgi:hypothetical protein
MEGHARFSFFEDLTILPVVFVINKKMSTHFTAKVGLYEKHTKFEKKNPRGFDKSADLLSKRQNHEEDFF